MSKNRTWSCLAGPGVPPSPDQPCQMGQSGMENDRPLKVEVSRNGQPLLQALVRQGELGQFLATLVQTLPELSQSIVRIDLSPLQGGGSGPIVLT